MKKIEVQHYDKIAKGAIVNVASFYFEGGKATEQPPRLVKIISASSKEREIKKDGEYTGQFETVADVVVFEELNREAGYCNTTIGQGLFKLYEAL